ncbi:MAG: CDP-2,3-bis-(O-geranylgeranyl)-sn-glycerol synthase [Candidatus Altiarchaeota archaeon]
MWDVVVAALWFILPAWVANSFAINVSGIGFLKRYGYPIDGDRTWRNRRVLGDGKTWRGFFGGVFFALLVGLIQASNQLRAESWYVETFPVASFSLIEMTVPLAFALGLGAMLGDMAGSFIKRQSGLDRGAPVPLLDQLDYIFGSFVFSIPFVTIPLSLFFWILIVTVPVHVAANIFAWLIKLKKVPW